MRVESFLEGSARRFPDKTALVAGERRLTYAELDEQAASLAGALAARGVQRGDRVAVFLENSPEAVVAIFGALKAGAVFTVLNPTTKAEKLAYILNNCRAAALVTQERLLPEAAAAVERAPSVLAT